MAKQNKIEKLINPEELPEFLRKLAGAIENGTSDDEAYFAVIDGFKRLKINIKHESDQVLLKLKAKPAEKFVPSELKANGEDEKPKYSSLKKRMKESFKTIFKSIHSGSLPPEDAVDLFLKDSQLMVTYHGYGDEYYAQYMKACSDFEKAFEDKDLEAAHKFCDSINSIKAHCHAKYD